MTWNWYDDKNYIAFDAYTSGLIEAAYANGDTSVTLTHGFFAKAR